MSSGGASLVRIRRARRGTTIQPPSARAAARGCWRVHPEAGDGPAKLPPPQADGAEALSRERPAPAQPPVAAPADGAERDAVSREHPATEAAQPPVAAPADGPERDAVSREHPATEAGQPPVAAPADGADAQLREWPATGTPPVTGQPPAASRVDGAETLLPEWSAVGPPRAAAQTAGPTAEVVPWEQTGDGAVPGDGAATCGFSGRRA